MEKSLNASFIALIPKRIGALNVKDFQLISLIWSCYKLLSKVLANRLKRVMGKLVFDSQNCFCWGEVDFGFCTDFE